MSTDSVPNGGMSQEHPAGAWFRLRDLETCKRARLPSIRQSSGCHTIFAARLASPLSLLCPLMVRLHVRMHRIPPHALGESVVTSALLSNVRAALSDTGLQGTWAML
ncbi:hypothetical protein ACCO45_006991 [Purpureocillium lilacinum]|uniref:Uncharacterized protein n=1 Tax=Purpureocillium lilacinum TaxID=33203 RepID=A0ACC4DTE0_PURLI